MQDPQADMLDEVGLRGDVAGEEEVNTKSRLVRVPCFALVERAFRLNAAADGSGSGQRQILGGR